MKLEILPTRTAGAAENMAADFLLLQRYPRPTAPRFRHYEWRAPAFTFGYSQRIAFVQAQLPPEQSFDLCRRPTGGGIVDHREDWTYALVIPRGHPLEDLRATHSYRLVHEALAEALQAQGVQAVVKPCPDDAFECASEPARPGHARSARTSTRPSDEIGGVCFSRAEIFDVVHAATGAKIAGAAQKRNKHGLLFQGSIWRPTAGGDVVDWPRFEDEFAGRIAAALNASAEQVPWPEFNEDELSGLTEQYASSEWIEHR